MNVIPSSAYMSVSIFLLDHPRSVEEEELVVLAAVLYALGQGG